MGVVCSDGFCATGKSTFLRQNALMCLLAQVWLPTKRFMCVHVCVHMCVCVNSTSCTQMGSYVPAQSATLGMVIVVGGRGTQCSKRKEVREGMM